MAERPHDPSSEPARRRLRRPQRLGPRVRDVQRLRPARLRRPDHVPEAAVDHRSGGDPGPQGRRRDRRGPVRRRRQPPPGRPLRAARDPRGELRDRLAPLAPASGELRAVRGPDGRRRRRREHRAGLARAGPRDDLPQGPRGRRDRRDPDRARRRPLDHLAVGDARSPRSARPAASGSSTSTPTPTPPTRTGACWPGTGRRCGG